MSGVLYEEIFDIKDIDPEGKQFERVKRIHAECESSKMELILDINSLLYATNIGDKVKYFSLKICYHILG
jgi:DNA-directed RNA polymerase I, II, and III subunit RPABC3